MVLHRHSTDVCVHPLHVFYQTNVLHFHKQLALQWLNPVSEMKHKQTAILLFIMSNKKCVAYVPLHGLQNQDQNRLQDLSSSVIK